VRRGDVITRKLADELLRAEVEGFEKDVLALVKVTLTQPRFDALVSFCYNVGAGEDGFAGSTARRMLNEGDFQGCADQLLRWNKGTVNGQLVELPGLTRRRKAERELFLSKASDADESPAPEAPPSEPSRAKPYAPCPVPLPWSETLDLGVIPSQDVYWLQCALIGLGYLGGPANPTTMVGDVFNEHVHYAVRKFQSNCMINADGVVGPDTRRCLENSLTKARVPKSAEPEPAPGGKPVRCEFHMDLGSSQALRAGSLLFLDANGTVVRKEPATSGLPGFQTHADLWRRGAGPVPAVEDQAILFSDGYYLTTPGIEGHAFPMRPDPIHGPNGKIRSEIMLHRDANVPGTAGCIGLLVSKKAYEAFVLWAKPLGRLPLKVIYT
jgi:GH24 family phage-related lysozyme (muramidase)